MATYVVSLESLVASNLTTGLLFMYLDISADISSLVIVLRVVKTTMNMMDTMTNAPTVQARNGLMVLLWPLLKSDEIAS